MLRRRGWGRLGTVRNPRKPVLMRHIFWKLSPKKKKLPHHQNITGKKTPGHSKTLQTRPAPTNHPKTHYPPRKSPKRVPVASKQTRKLPRTSTPVRYRPVCPFNRARPASDCLRLPAYWRLPTTQLPSPISSSLRYLIPFKKHLFTM